MTVALDNYFFLKYGGFDYLVSSLVLLIEIAGTESQVKLDFDSCLTVYHTNIGFRELQGTCTYYIEAQSPR